MLRPAEQRALRCIDVWIRHNGTAPTRRELAARLGLPPTTAHKLVDALVRKGRLRRLPRRRCGIEVERYAYFKFDDERKQLVRWRPKELRT